MPDCFRGKPWTTEKMETLGMPAVIEFVKEVGTTDIVSAYLVCLFVLYVYDMRTFLHLDTSFNKDISCIDYASTSQSSGLCQSPKYK